MWVQLICVGCLWLRTRRPTKIRCARARGQAPSGPHARRWLHVGQSASSCQRSPLTGGHSWHHPKPDLGLRGSFQVARRMRVLLLLRSWGHHRGRCVTRFVALIKEPTSTLQLQLLFPRRDRTHRSWHRSPSSRQLNRTSDAQLRPGTLCRLLVLKRARLIG